MGLTLKKNVCSGGNAIRSGGPGHVAAFEGLEICTETCVSVMSPCLVWHDGNSKTEATCEKWECHVHHEGGGCEVPVEPASCEEQWL